MVNLANVPIKYIKINEDRSRVSRNLKPIEINVTALGKDQCQIGGTIESDISPITGALTTLIDGDIVNFITFGDDLKPSIIVTLPEARTDITQIMVRHTDPTDKPIIYVSENKVDWFEITFEGEEDDWRRLRYSIPVLSSIEFTTSIPTWIEINDNPDMDISDGQFGTVEFFIKFKSDLPNEIQAITDKGDLGTQQYYMLMDARSGTPQIKFKLGNSHEITVNRTNDIIGRWVHMAFVMDGPKIIYYEDGELIHQEEGLNYFFSRTNIRLTFGRTSDRQMYYGNFLYNYHRVWNVARSQTDIKDNAYYDVDPKNPDLKGYWIFNNRKSKELTGGLHEGYLKNNVTFPLENPVKPSPFMPIRYVKDYIYNSPDGKGQWSEISVYSNGENVALNKTVTSSLTVNNPLSIITDGQDGNVSNQFVESASYGEVIVDLGDHFKLDEIKVNHYWDGRIYGHIVSVSENGLVWYPIYNTEKDGDYPSFHSGKVFTVPTQFEDKYKIVPIKWVETQNVTIQGQTVTKTSGGAGWNAGAQSKQITEGKSFIIEFIPIFTNTRIAFGLDEGRDTIDYGNKEVDFCWEINPDGQCEINVRATNQYRGTYNAGDVFQVMFLDQTIYFLQNNNVFYTFNSANDFPYFADFSIHGQGASFTPTLYMERTDLIRYVRDWAAGSNVNGACVWLEIEANRKGENVALNKEITPSVAMSWGHYQVTDGSFNMNDYTWQMTYDAPQYVEIDLGQVYSDLEEIKIWHYPDGRIFNKLKTQVSSDGINWHTLFDSDINGTYVETMDGLSIPLMEQERSLDLSRDSKEYAIIPHDNSLNVTNYLTMEFWIKLKPLPNDFQVIIDKGNIGTTQYYVIHEGRNGNNQIKYRFGNGHERTVNRPNTIIDKWTHMAFTFNGAEMIFYEDGEQILKENFPDFVFTPNTMDLAFGRMSASDGAYLGALLDEIRIWNIVRTASEIKENMLGVDPNLKGLIGYWKANNSGTILLDNSINVNHGTLKNGASFSTDQPIPIGPSSQNFEQTAQLNIGMNENAAKTYTANGYIYNGWTLNYLDYYFYADQNYTAIGYEYEQTATEPQGLTQTAAQNYTAHGYEFIGSDSQEIIFDFGAAQVYTPEGYSFQQSTQENIFVSYVGGQAYTPEGYDRASMAQENILLVSIAAQVYTANGYHYETITSQAIGALNQEAAQIFAAHFEQEAQESLNLSMQAAQIFAAHFEQFETQFITLGAVANVEYQANFRANAIDTVFVIESGSQTVVFSEGLQFQQNAQNNINITHGAAQEFTPFGGYSFSQNSSNTIILNAAASLLYELGEIGKYSQRATLYLPLQVSTQTTYTRNWLDFEAKADTKQHVIYMLATNEHTKVNIFEATTLETFYLHHTDKSLHEVVYLSYNQNMFYDLLFWHFADSLHTINHLEFTGQANESTTLLMAASVQYTNANMLNDFATAKINLTMAAHVEHIEATIYEFNEIVTEDIDLNLVAASEHIVATIYEFAQKANESMALAFGAVSEHIEAHIFTHEINENINSFYYAFSEYQNINPFVSKANDLLMVEHWATFEVTTEPRNYEAAVELNITLTIKNWVYFESDIYEPTYKIEVKKPNTIWEPTDEDRPNPYIFGRNPDNKIDRRILSLTHIREPKKISYEKPNTLYTHNEELERGLIDD